MQNYQKLNRSIAILLVILSLGCSKSVFAEQPQQLHLLGEVKGNVKIQKGGKPSKGFIGDTIDFLTTFIFGKGASAKVICHDGSTRTVSSGTSKLDRICKNTTRTILTKEKTSYTRGEKTLTDADRLEIDADVKNLQQQPIDNNAKGIAVAYLYQSKGLYNEGIEELEKLVAGGSKTTSVYQLLGSIYQQRGIDKLAKARYQTGLKLAKKEGNVKAQKYIQEQLKVLISI
jgi:tetratricopeptide (TPR) repeat protein